MTEKTILLSEHKHIVAISLELFILIALFESWMLVGTDYELLAVINTAWCIFGYGNLINYFYQQRMHP
jgi:hypothetical protein